MAVSISSSTTNGTQCQRSLPAISSVFGVDFVMQNVWQCPKKHLEQQFIQNVTMNHLEVGVNNDFDFTKRLKANKNLTIAYLDPNAKALKQAGKITSHLNPRLFQGDLMFKWNFSSHKFSSINLNFVLHGLSGGFEDRVNALCMNARNCLTENGKIFGSAILKDTTKRSAVADYFIKRGNKSGVMCNKADNFRKLERMLSYYFANVRIRMEGYVVLFEAKMKDMKRRGVPDMQPYNSRRNVVHMTSVKPQQKSDLAAKEKRKEILARNRQRFA